ncbi:MAG TPA: nucleoside transporter C-terminal domain-containing protein [Burkholderiales bacterium]|nr:nucleoside transporter C-terminal domain-containing protein [Burkholderiales bacterium]
MDAALFAQSAFGFLALHALAWAVSENRRGVTWRPVLAGIALTLILGALFLKVPVFGEAFLVLNRAVEALERATQAGTSFVFGYLGGAPLPYEEKPATSSFVLAFRALPLVMVISALSSLLFYWRVLPWVVRLFARVLERTMGVGGAVGLSAAANVFVGMVEAPLFVRPYIGRMSRSELFVMMSCGMATIAGTVMVLYASLIGKVVPGALGHILIASIIATPAAITVSLLMVPPAPHERAIGGTAADLEPSAATSSMDAITRGTLDGAALLINIVAMLLVLVALVHLANAILGLAPHVGGAPVTLQRMLGFALAPLAWLAGVPWAEAPVAGQLLGTKTILNELLAYIDLAKLDANSLSPRSRLIMTYALCGFANLGSLGIMIGGLATMAPERRTEIVALGALTLVSGTLATLIAGATVGILY